MVYGLWFLVFGLGFKIESWRVCEGANGFAGGCDCGNLLIILVGFFFHTFFRRKYHAERDR
jgi:hypothetical protein